jgi:hypothetical protein
MQQWFKMDIEDYFIIALIFAIIALISNSESYGLFFNDPFNVELTLGMHTFRTGVNLLIFLPSAYVAIAFTVGGFIKAFVKVVKVIIRENRKKPNPKSEDE